MWVHICRDLQAKLLGCVGPLCSEESQSNEEETNWSAKVDTRNPTDRKYKNKSA